MGTLREELQSLYDARGKLTPEIVVEEASREDHPLHSRFEWDDAVAGAKYRLEQAAKLIRSVRVVIDRGPKAKPLSVRAFHNVPSPERGSYVPVKEVASNDLTRAVVLRAAEREWRELKARYEHLQEFMDMIRRDVAVEVLA